MMFEGGVYFSKKSKQHAHHTMGYKFTMQPSQVDETSWMCLVSSLSHFISAARKRRPCKTLESAEHASQEVPSLVCDTLLAPALE